MVKTLLVMAGWFGCVVAGFGGERPNVVFFLADDVSQEDVGCYGHPTVETPNINALAEDGLRFDNGVLTISSCSPSRCSIITGRYPHNTGAPELHTKLPEGQVLFPKLLKEAGYYTALSGKHHMGDWASTAFDRVSRGRGPGKEEDWVEVVRERPKDRPFFFWFASTDAHRDWQTSGEVRKYRPEEVVVPPYLIDGPGTRKDLTGYYHEISRFDHYVGAVVAELERQGVMDDTVIIVTADNGRPFPRAKTRLYDCGIKPPMIWRFPGRIRAGVTMSLASSIDISATVLELAGVEADERIQGVSLVPVFADHEAVVREVAFAEHNWHVFPNHERMVRFGDWLYIRNNLPDQRNLCVEAYDGLAGKELWQAQKDGSLTDVQRNVFRNPCPDEELYQVGRDPHQLNNVVGNPENLAVLKKARRLLGDWTEQTGDTIPKVMTTATAKAPGDQGPKPKMIRGEMPGAAAGAETIKHKGPLTL
ncbi:MAG: sulfatase family protein [Verrucomicrobiales bacterium]|nr:sulfatase [Verrucomicrobiota bacterium JB025]